MNGIILGIRSFEIVGSKHSENSFQVGHIYDTSDDDRMSILIYSEAVGIDKLRRGLVYGSDQAYLYFHTVIVLN